MLRVGRNTVMEQARLFLRLFYWFSVRHLLRQPWRVAAVLVGIALGAAVFTSVRLAGGMQPSILSPRASI